MVANRGLGGQTEGDDQGDWQGSRSQAALLTATVGERAQRRALVAAPAGDQGADPLGGVQLVAAEADQIDAGMAQRVEVLAETLRLYI